MIKIFSILIVTLLVSVNPVQAYSGLSIDEIRTEITRLNAVAETLRAQLRQLGDDPSSVTAGSVGVSTTVTQNVPTYTSAASAGCLQTNRQMRKGHSGGSVTALQQFLVQAGVYSATLVTSYFGPATEAGVQRWQASHGVVSSGTPNTTGYGKVGPATLRAMHSGCPLGRYTGTSGSLTGNTVSTPQGAISGSTALGTQGGVSSTGALQVEKYNLSVDTTRGFAPLSTSLTFNIEGSACTSYSLDWGDNSTKIVYDSARATDCTSLPINVQPSHVYMSPGNYTIRLKTGRGPLSRIVEVSQINISVLGTPSVSN